MRRSRRCAGFTLLEILVALVLLAFVMAGVWGALAGATRVTRAEDAVMARSESVRTAQEFVRRYVSAAQVQPFVTRRGARPQVFDGGATSMRYVAPLPMQSGHAGLYVQTLSLDRNPAGDDVALKLAYRPYADGASTGGTAVTHVLLADLRDGTFQYLGAGIPGKPAAWRDDWKSADGLPRAIRIRLDPAWSVRVPFPELVIPLHAGDGSGAAPEAVQ